MTTETTKPQKVIEIIETTEIIKKAGQTSMGTEKDMTIGTGTITEVAESVSTETTAAQLRDTDRSIITEVTRRANTAEESLTVQIAVISR